MKRATLKSTEKKVEPALFYLSPQNMIFLNGLVNELMRRRRDVNKSQVIRYTLNILKKEKSHEEILDGIDKLEI